jgi:hypothetical protein
MKAMPSATTCVDCLDAAGDVFRIQRLDEFYGHEGEFQQSTYIKEPNQYFDKAILRFLKTSHPYGSMTDAEMG